MGAVGDAYDNALAESFVDTFKTQLVTDRVWKTRAQLELAIVECGGRAPARPPRAAPGREPGRAEAKSTRLRFWSPGERNRSRVRRGG